MRRCLLLLMLVRRTREDGIVIPEVSPTSECNADLNAQHTANVTILTTLPPLPSWQNGSVNPHLYEILAAIGENARNLYVGEVRVLLDTGPWVVGSPEKLDDRVTQEVRREILAAQHDLRDRLEAMATDRDLEKIRAHVFGHQPTYAELFRYASYALPGRIVSLMNADVVLRNLHRLDAAAFWRPPPLGLVLTVREPTGPLYEHHCERRVADRCVGWQSAGKSYDGFVFATPLPATARYDMLEEFPPIPVYMNEYGAENRAKQFLFASGFDLVNPCLSRIAVHWHCRQKMHHQHDRVDVKNHKNIILRLGGWPLVPVNKDTRGLTCAPSS